MMSAKASVSFLPSVTAAVRRLVPGLGLTAAIAGVATSLAAVHELAAAGIGALTVAILLGMVVGNTVSPAMAQATAPGVSFAKQTLLRAGIVAYGLRLTLQDIYGVGAGGVIIDLVMLTSTFAMACWLGPRVLGLDCRTSMLVGIGSSICGAAAILAAEPVLRGRPEQTAVAIATVVVFGTLAMFAYPAIYHLNASLHVVQWSSTAYGIYAGSTIHEVAQVLVAGRAIDNDAAATAVIAKMVRVLMLAPFLILLSAGLRRCGSTSASTESAPGSWLTTVPWFAVGFAALAAFNSCVALPEPVVEALLQIDGVVLAMAMGALGLTTHLQAIRTAGAKPLLLATLLFAWLMCGGLAVNAGIHAVLG